MSRISNTITFISSWKLALREMSPFLFLIVAVFPILAPTAQATDRCNGDVSGEIEGHVAQELALPQKSLFASLRADLNDSLITSQFVLEESSSGRAVSNASIPITKIAIFDLSRQGYRLIDGRLTEMVIDLDSSPMWRVGYNCSTGTFYHLNGFSDTEQGFNSLISELGVKVKSTDSALEILRAFVALTYRTGVQELMRRRLDLLKAAFDEYSGEDNINGFFAYWKRIPVALQREIVPPTVSVSGGQFIVKCFLGDEEGIQNVVLSMSGEGHVHLQSETLVFHWPAKK
jgi:hypothetical protein